MKQTQEMCTTGSQSTRADTVCGEGKSDDDVRNLSEYPSQPSFRLQTATVRALYPSEMDEERCDNCILQKLMKMRVRTTETRLEREVLGFNERAEEDWSGMDEYSNEDDNVKVLKEEKEVLLHVSQDASMNERADMTHESSRIEKHVSSRDRNSKGREQSA